MSAKVIQLFPKPPRPRLRDEGVDALREALRIASGFHKLPLPLRALQVVVEGLAVVRGRP